MRSQSADLLDDALASGQPALSEYDSKRLLAGFGLPVTREHLVKDLDGALAAAGEIGYPLVLKACGPQLQHKTEGGLVALNLRTSDDLCLAFSRIQEKLKGETANFLVQEMISGDREFVAGMVRDPHYGPCVMFGLGGIFAEALADVSFRVAPLTRKDAREMIEETTASFLLKEVRGMPGVDRSVLIDILITLGDIGLNLPQVGQIDLNPLMIRDGVPVAADALVVPEQTVPVPSEAGRSGKPGIAPFFSPKRIAVIGASASRHKAGNDVIRNLLANGFEGNIHLVNPKGGMIMGMPVLKSVAELPDHVDQAIIILPARANPGAIRECAAKGIRYIVLAAGGFAEADDKGKRLQAELEKAMAETGVRVLGPNTSGHTSTPSHFTSSFFPLGKVPKGRISYLAQTGNFATHTMRHIATAENFGVARVIGLGNKLDVEESEALEYLGQDPETSAIICYLESIKYPKRFLDAARKITPKKPVIVLKGGSSEQGARAAVAHTAALASDQRITEAAFRQAGIVQIWQYSYLILAAKALACMPIPLGNRVGIVAPSGAMLVSLTDLCHRRLGLCVPEVREKTRGRLQEISPDIVRMRNPVDIWPSATVHGPEFAYREGTAALIQDQAIDAVVVVLMLTDETGVPPLDFLIDLAHRHPEKPLYVTFSAEQKHMAAAKNFLESRGVPTFPLIEHPFEVLSILAGCRQAMSLNGADDTVPEPQKQGQYTNPRIKG